MVNTQRKINYLGIETNDGEYLRVYNWVTLDYDFMDKDRLTELMKRLSNYKKQIIKHKVVNDMKMFFRKSTKGFHLLIVFPKEYKNFYSKNIPMDFRRKFYDDPQRIKYDNHRIENLHTMSFDSGILFDYKNGSYRKKWIELEF